MNRYSLLPLSFLVDLRKRDYSTLSCWAVDPFHGYSQQVLEKFKALTMAIRDQSPEAITGGKKWVVVESNCPLFRYWLDSPETCERIKSLGYIGEPVSCTGDGDRRYAQLVHNVFQRHFRFREPFLQFVEQILEPYRSRLIVDPEDHSLFPVPEVPESGDGSCAIWHRRL